MKKRKISITSESGVKLTIESECTSEQAKKINANRSRQIAGFEKDFDVNVIIRITKQSKHYKTVIIEKTLNVLTSDKIVETFSAMKTIANEFFNMVDSWQPEEPKNTEKTSQDDRREYYVEFCKSVLCTWDKPPRTFGATIEGLENMFTPTGWICGDLLQKLLQCYVEHNS